MNLAYYSNLKELWYRNALWINPHVATIFISGNKRQFTPFLYNTNNLDMSISFYKKCIYCNKIFEENKRGFLSLSIHPFHFENVFHFIREHDFLSRTEKALHKKYALHLRNFNTRNNLQIGRCAVILFVGSYLVKDLWLLATDTK